MASEPAKQRREIVVINKTEGTVKDRWDIIERAVKILSLGAIPLLIAGGAWLTETHLQEQTVRREYVQIAVAILQVKDQDPALRDWAAMLLEKNSPTELPDAAYQQLKSGKALLPKGALFAGPRSAPEPIGRCAVLSSLDGSTASALFDDLGIELEDGDGLQHRTSKTCLAKFVRGTEKPNYSITAHVRGYIFLSENAKVTITVELENHDREFTFPSAEQDGIELVDGHYEGDILLEIIAPPATWPVRPGDSLHYPFRISIAAQRKSKDDIVDVQIDSLDAVVLSSENQ